MIFCRPFIQYFEQTAEDIDMYSDASGSVFKGFGVNCGKQWTAMQWDATWMKKEKPSIEFLELYTVTVSVLLWIKKFKDTKVLLHCDNESVCRMINSTSSGCKKCMMLIRLIVLEGLLHNVQITAEWVATGDNGKADALSRMEFDKFWKLADEDGKEMDGMPTAMPTQIWPVTKFWNNV